MGRQHATRFGSLVAQLDPQTLFAFYFTFQGEGQLQRLPTAAWEIEKLEEFVVFAPGVFLALPLDVFARLTPIRDSGEGPSPRGTPKSWRRGGGSPPIEHDRLTGGPVGEAIERDTTIRRAKGVTVRERMCMRRQTHATSTARA